jgi:hypothetical protein
MGTIVDPGNNFAYDFHQYFDWNYSGTNTTCINATIGSDTLNIATGWLRQKGFRGFLTEFTAANNDVCLQALNGALQHMQNNTDVWLGWTFWAAGPMWTNYPFSIEPVPNYIFPQMEVLTKYLPQSSILDNLYKWPIDPLPPTVIPTFGTTGGEEPSSTSQTTSLPSTTTTGKATDNLAKSSSVALTTNWIMWIALAALVLNM